MEMLYSVLLAVLVFLIPSNLFLKFGVNTAYVHGLLSDYLIPKLYVSDLVILSVLVIWASELIGKSREKFGAKLAKISFLKPPLVTSIFFSLLFIFGCAQFFTLKPFASIWFLCKLIEMVALAIFLFTHTQFLKTKTAQFAWWASFLFQSFIGLYQFFFQQSFASFLPFPSYLFFGEPNLSHPLFLAKGVFNGPFFNGAEKILPYGTTAHPNTLAGFLVVGILVNLILQKKLPLKNFLSQIFFAISLVLALLTLLLTQSVSAWLALAIGLFIFFSQEKLAKFFAQKTQKKQKISWIFLATFLFTLFIFEPILMHALATQFPKVPSFTRRDQLNQAAFGMIRSHPLTGVGLNNFTAYAEKYNPSDEVIRFIQPAHNLGILWLTETGLLGIATFCASIFWLTCIIKKTPIFLWLFFLLPIISLDHYLLTLQTGLLILVLSSVYFLP